jgi:Uma2 family endonuclease
MEICSQLRAPAPRHVVAQGALQAILAGPFQFGSGAGPGGWWILMEPEIHMDSHVLVPDLAGWRRSRLPFPPTQGQFTLTPDWVCEILSPSTQAFDHKEKRRVYAEQKVHHLWFVDPISRSIDALRLTGDLYSIVDTFGGDEKAHIEPFEAIELDLGLLWLPDSPPVE